MAFLQPILVPFAVAGVLAYLLEPAVEWLEKRGLNRQRSVLLAFAIFALAMSGLGWWMVVKLGDPAVHLAERVPGYVTKARQAVLDFSARIEKEHGIALLPHVSVGAEGQLGGFSLRCDDDPFDVARGQALKCDLAAVGVDCVTMWRGYEGGAQSGAGTGGAGAVGAELSAANSSVRECAIMHLRSGANARMRSGVFWRITENPAQESHLSASVTPKTPRRLLRANDARIAIPACALF
jgi:hypothetical protein